MLITAKDLLDRWINNLLYIDRPHNRQLCCDLVTLLYFFFGHRRNLSTHLMFSLLVSHSARLFLGFLLMLEALPLEALESINWGTKVTTMRLLVDRFSIKLIDTD